MTLAALAQPPEPAPILACTIARDISRFELLIEDMETALSERWGDLGFDEALRFLGQPDAPKLDFVVLAVDSQDEGEAELARLGTIIRTARSRQIPVLVVAEEVSPIALHRLLGVGADGFLPYPLPEKALAEAIRRLNTPPATQVALVQPPEATTGPSAPTPGRLIAVQSIAGGVGGTTFATNLAWELATADKKAPLKLCIIDLDLQKGAVATYLDVDRRSAVTDLLADPGTLDRESFLQSLVPCRDVLKVFTAPTDLMPLDIVSPADIDALLTHALESFDVVVVDMPGTVVAWTETVLRRASVFYAVMCLDMRSAHNAMRLKQALAAEALPADLVQYVLNRAPGFADLSGKARMKRLSEQLSITFAHLLPDGGKTVLEANDHGTPLAGTQARNPLRKEIARIATALRKAPPAAKTA